MYQPCKPRSIRFACTIIRNGLRNRIYAAWELSVPHATFLSRTLALFCSPAPICTLCGCLVAGTKSGSFTDNRVARKTVDGRRIDENPPTNLGFDDSEISISLSPKLTHDRSDQYFTGEGGCSGSSPNRVSVGTC